MFSFEPHLSKHAISVFLGMTERVWVTFLLFLCLNQHQISFCSDGKFWYTFTFLNFYWTYKVHLKRQYPPKAFLKLRIPTCTSQLTGPRDSKGHDMDFMICPLIWTCRDEQMDFLFFKGRVEIHKKFRCDIAQLFGYTHTQPEWGLKCIYIWSQGLKIPCWKHSKLLVLTFG